MGPKRKKEEEDVKNITWKIQIIENQIPEGTANLHSRSQVVWSELPALKFTVALNEGPSKIIKPIHNVEVGYFDWELEDDDNDKKKRYDDNDAVEVKCSAKIFICGRFVPLDDQEKNDRDEDGLHKVCICRMEQNSFKRSNLWQWRPRAGKIVLPLVMNQINIMNDYLNAVVQERGQEPKDYLWDMTLKITVTRKRPFASIANKKIKTINNILDDLKFTDFVIDCEGQKFPCHKFMLAQRSKALEAMLHYDKELTRRGILVLKEGTVSGLREFFSLIYTGTWTDEARVTNVSETLVLCDKYLMEEEAKKCCEYLGNNLTMDNMVPIMVLAYDLARQHLLEYTQRYIYINADAFAWESSQEWSELHETRPDVALNLYKSTSRDREGWYIKLSLFFLHSMYRLVEEGRKDELCEKYPGAEKLAAEVKPLDGESKWLYDESSDYYQLRASDLLENSLFVRNLPLIFLAEGRIKEAMASPGWVELGKKLPQFALNVFSEVCRGTLLIDNFY